MLLVYGLGLFAAGSLLFAAGYRIFRRPQPPGWLQDGVMGDIFTVTVIGLLVMGFGLLIKFVATLSEQSVGAMELGLGLAIALATAFAVRWILGGRKEAGEGPGREPSVRQAGPSESGQVVPLEPLTTIPSGASGPGGQPLGGGKGRKKRAA